jgi:hypothetical protein
MSNGLRGHRLSLFLAALLAVSAGLLRAQESRGAIVGMVTDPDGRPLEAVRLEALNVATGVAVTTRTNDRGLYRTPYLNAGTYRVTAEKDGFRKHQRTGVVLHVADTLNIDVALDVGGIVEEVTVSAATTGVETSTASLGQVVDARSLQALPVREGSPIELVILAPGVVNTTDLRSRKAAFNNGLSQWSTDGAGEKRNEFTIDGIPNTAGDRVAYSPPTSFVEEFKIQTTTHDAALGFTMGAVVNVVTKSGTNLLHGEAHEWYRGSKLDAGNFFDNRAGNKKRTYHDNRFGASVGGPLRLPGYDGRNRTFFFLAFEANPFGVPQPRLLTVPTERQRRGDFSELLALGPQYQIYDPATIRPDPTAPGRFIRDPFPGNVIPANRLDPIARNILGYWPLPNQQGTPDGRNNYAVPSAVAKETYYTLTGRADHSFSERHRVYGRFSWDFWEEEKDDLYGNLSTGIFLNRRNRVAALDDTYTLSTNLLFNARLGYTRQLFPERRRSQGFALDELGFSPALVGLVPAETATFPNVRFDNYSGFGGWESGDGHFTTDIYSANANMTWLRGSHTLRFGSEFRMYREDSGRFPTDYSPRIDFTSVWTRGPRDNSPAAPNGQDLASFLLGYVGGGQMTRTSSYTETTRELGFFVQDDWRVGRKLTVNVGLRYELDIPVTEAQDRTINGFDFTTPLPIEAQVRANYARSPIAEVPADRFGSRGGVLYAGVDGRPRGLWKRNLTNFMPRIGFSYAPNDRTAIRGGYGLFYDTLGTNRINVEQTGFSRTTALVPSLDNGRTFNATFANPFPNGLLEPVGSSLGLMTGVGGNIGFPYNGEARNPRNHRWSLGFQRELPAHVLFEATYVGSYGERLPVSREINAVPRPYFSTAARRDQAANDRLTQAVPNPFFPLLPGTSLSGQTVQRQQLLRPYPQFTSIRAIETIGSADYHALQARLERRMPGLTLTVAYTWSRTMTETGYLNDFDTRLERVISLFDRTHVLVGSGVWELPFGKGRRWGRDWSGARQQLAGGWKVSAIFRSQSGAPLGFGNFLLKDGSTIDDVPLPSGQRTPDRWFNVDPFERAAGQQLVSNVRTTPSRFANVRGPGYSVWDLGLIKDVALNDRVGLQLRLEVYNALNHANFGNPNATPTSSSFGAITAQNGFPRQIQLATRVIF